MMRRYEIVMAVEIHVLAFRGFTALPLSLPVVLSFPRGRRERKYKLSFTLRYFDIPLIYIHYLDVSFNREERRKN